MAGRGVLAITAEQLSVAFDRWFVRPGRFLAGWFSRLAHEVLTPKSLAVAESVGPTESLRSLVARASETRYPAPLRSAVVISNFVTCESARVECFEDALRQVQREEPEQDNLNLDCCELLASRRRNP